jgi:hypothetical protein
LYCKKLLIFEDNARFTTALRKANSYPRGFIDGYSLWRMKYEKGIDFIIPVKCGMTIWGDATGFRETAERAGMIEIWHYGKGESGGYFVPGLLSYGEYNKEPAKSKKYKNGCPLNAVVVTL